MDEDIEQISPTTFIKRTRSYFETVDEEVGKYKAKHTLKIVAYYFLCLSIFLITLFSIIFISRLAYMI